MNSIPLIRGGRSHDKKPYHDSVLTDRDRSDDVEKPGRSPPTKVAFVNFFFTFSMRRRRDNNVPNLPDQSLCAVTLSDRPPRNVRERAECETILEAKAKPS